MGPFRSGDPAAHRRGADGPGDSASPTSGNGVERLAQCVPGRAGGRGPGTGGDRPTHAADGAGGHLPGQRRTPHALGRQTVVHPWFTTIVERPSDHVPVRVALGVDDRCKFTHRPTRPSGASGSRPDERTRALCRRRDCGIGWEPAHVGHQPGVVQPSPERTIRRPGVRPLPADARTHRARLLVGSSRHRHSRSHAPQAGVRGTFQRRCTAATSPSSRPGGHRRIRSPDDQAERRRTAGGVVKGVARRSGDHRDRPHRVGADRGHLGCRCGHLPCVRRPGGLSRSPGCSSQRSPQRGPGRRISFR